jgi:hypothetical protein
MVIKVVVFQVSPILCQKTIVDFGTVLARIVLINFPQIEPFDKRV